MSILTVGARRLALVAAFGLTLASAGAATAGDKPGTGKGAPSKTATPKPAASLAEIVSSFDMKDEEARVALQKGRFDAIAAYVKANGAAKDAEKARKSLIDLAEKMENWTDVARCADEFLAAHAASESKGEVALSKAGALSNLGKFPESKAAYEAITKDAKPDQAGFNAWMGYAGVLEQSGDLVGAKAAYASLKALIPNQQVHMMADSGVKAIDAIGTDPAEFTEESKDLEGKAVSLKEYAGKVVLIDFWATWCGPCRHEIPSVVAAYQKFHDKGFEIIGVTLDKPGDGEVVKTFAADHDMAWRQILDNEHESVLAQAYGARSIPHTVLVGRDGKIAKVGVRGKALEVAVARLLAVEAPMPATPAK